MDIEKIALKLQGDMCLDDSDKNLIMIWSKAIDVAEQPLIAVSYTHLTLPTIA